MVEADGVNPDFVRALVFFARTTGWINGDHNAPQRREERVSFLGCRGCFFMVGSEDLLRPERTNNVATALAIGKRDLVVLDSAGDVNTLARSLKTLDCDVFRMGSSCNLPEARLSRIVNGMEVHFTPGTEKKLKDLSAQSGRGIDDFVEDATAAYVDELLRTRDMLNTLMTT